MRLKFVTINVLSAALENPTTMQSRRLFRGMPAQDQLKLPNLVAQFKAAQEDLLASRRDMAGLLSDLYLFVAGQHRSGSTKEDPETIAEKQAVINIKERDVSELGKQILALLTSNGHLI